MSLTGPDAATPTRFGVPIGDALAGMYGASGVLAALYERSEPVGASSFGTSLLASVVGVHTFHGTKFTVAGEIGEAIGNHHSAIAPYGMFRCGTGAIQVAVANQRQWRSFCDVVGIDSDDTRFVTKGERVAHRDELIDHIEEHLARRSARDWLEQLDVTGIPCGEVRTLDQVYAEHQTRSQGLVIEVDHTAVVIELPGRRCGSMTGAEGTHLPRQSWENTAGASANWPKTIETDRTRIASGGRRLLSRTESLSFCGVQRARHESRSNRPAKHNAFTDGMYSYWSAGSASPTPRDPELRVVVFQGEGGRAFAAGNYIATLP